MEAASISSCGSEGDSWGLAVIVSLVGMTSEEALSIRERVLLCWFISAESSNDFR